jgi:hypothetical protein
MREWYNISMYTITTLQNNTQIKPATIEILIHNKNNGIINPRDMEKEFYSYLYKVANKECILRHHAPFYLL